MNYNLHYERLIERAKNRPLIIAEYYERHHIVPKSMGGSNHKNNLVSLLPEEHIIAHLLLMRIHNYHPKLVQAVSCMTNGFNKSKNNSKNNKEYGFIKRIISKTQSAYLRDNHYLDKMTDKEREEFLNNNVRGENNKMYGKTHTKAAKVKIGKANKRMFAAIDKYGKKIRIKNDDERYLSGEFIAQSRGRQCTEEVKNGKRSSNVGYKNPNAKKYIVFDENDNIIFDGIGGFVQFITNLGIPKCAVYKAIKENTKLYQTPRQQMFAKKNSVEKFIGWRFERLN